MLALSRKRDEAIVLDNGVRIEVIKVSGTRVTLGVEAPRDVRILREELVVDGVVLEGLAGDRSCAVTSQP